VTSANCTGLVDDDSLEVREHGGQGERLIVTGDGDPDPSDRLARVVLRPDGELPFPGHGVALDFALRVGPELEDPEGPLDRGPRGVAFGRVGLLRGSLPSKPELERVGLLLLGSPAGEVSGAETEGLEPNPHVRRRVAGRVGYPQGERVASGDPKLADIDVFSRLQPGPGSSPSPRAGRVELQPLATAHRDLPGARLQVREGEAAVHQGPRFRVARVLLDKLTIVSRLSPAVEVGLDRHSVRRPAVLEQDATGDLGTGNEPQGELEERSRLQVEVMLGKR